MKRAHKPSRTRQPKPPRLRFSPTAWAKLLFLRDLGDSEVGAFGVSAGDDLLLVERVELVAQEASCVTVCFDDEAVADYFDQMVDEGIAPERAGRIWIHTHPGSSPRPSGTDEHTFQRVFGNCQWAVMFILAEYGQSYARLAFNVGPRAELEIPIEIDYSRPFDGADLNAWEDEYQRLVRITASAFTPTGPVRSGGVAGARDAARQNLFDRSWWGPDDQFLPKEPADDHD